MNHKRTLTLLIMALVLAALFFSPVSAANKTNATPPGWVGEFDEWAGPKDMSQYNPVVPAVTPQKMDAQTAWMYHGVVFIEPAITFPLVESVVHTNASPITTVDFQYLNRGEKPDSTTSHLPAPESGNNSVVPTSPAPVATATRIIPPGGGAPSEILTNMYPTVKGNAAIMEFIGECGVGNWHEEQMNADFKSVHLPPANSCGKQLVFSMRKSGGRDDPTRITDIWIIGANETWSVSMIPVYLRGWIPLVPGFVVVCAVIAAGLLAVLYRMMRRDRQS